MNANLLHSHDECRRQAVWLNEGWEFHKLRATEMVYRALRESLTDTENYDHGTVAGNTVMGYMAERGLDTPHFLLYDIGLHHAALADLLSVHLRPIGSPAWGIAADKDEWESRCYLKGNQLHRVILVDHWSDERLNSESRSWYTLGEMATYELPMMLHVIVLGASVSGKRHSAWTKALLHPKSKQLRMKKKHAKWSGFADTWIPVYREDRGEISRDKWMQTMKQDDVLRDLSLTVNVELPEAHKLKEIRSDIREITKEIGSTRRLPRKVYSVCWWPIPCQFRGCCWGKEETTPAEARGFVQISRCESSSSRQQNSEFAQIQSP